MSRRARRSGVDARITRTDSDPRTNNQIVSTSPVMNLDREYGPAGRVSVSELPQGGNAAALTDRARGVCSQPGRPYDGSARAVTGTSKDSDRPGVFRRGGAALDRRHP